MKSNSITIKDIAKALSLSYSTVARALNDSYMISEPVKQKVQAYASLHNYRPNLMAQSLRSKKTRSIGVIVPAIPNSFFAEAISGIESVAGAKDYKVIITQSFESYEKEVKNLEHLTWHAVDGLIVSIAAETTDVSHFKKVHDQGIPIVFFDRITDLINTHTIAANNKVGSYQATKHLIENGYTRIAHITSAQDLSITEERIMGYTAALSDNNMVMPKAYTKYCQHGGMLMQEMEQVIDELLSLDSPPDAIFAASDRITLGVLTILDSRKIQIPNQIAVVGFTNFNAPQLLNPSLTTVSQPAFDMGSQSVELLINLIETKRPITDFKQVVLPTQLVIRKSSEKKTN